MATYVGNLSNIIDFKKVLENLGSGCLEDSNIKDEDGNLREEAASDERWVKLYEAGYPGLVCSGKIYTARHHFDEDVVHRLDEFFGTVCVRMLISEFTPGHVVPPHFDYIRENDPDLEKKILELGTIEAYHIHIGDPEEGHIFVINGRCHYNEESGNCYKWENCYDWHCSTNTGFKNKYLMSYFGLKPYKPLPEYTYRFHDDTEQVDLVFSDGSIL